MKTKWILITFVSLALVLVFAAAALAETLTVTGTVELTEKGAVLVTADERFLLQGKDIVDFDGQTVTVTGVVEPAKEEMRIINVEKIQEVTQ